MVLRSRFGKHLNACSRREGFAAAARARRWQRIINRIGMLEARFPGAVDRHRIRSEDELDDLVAEAERLLKFLKIRGNRLFLTVDESNGGYNAWDPARKGFFAWDRASRTFAE